MNRLNLDFSLSTTEERSAFVNEYMKQKQFQVKAPTSAELETIANYILWGKDPLTGKNAKQDKSIELESRSKTWDSKEIESLDALIETPTFRESQVHPMEGPHYKTPKIIFSRAEARKNAPPHILEVFEDLWRQIDRTDLLINYYDLDHNKRKNPPRDELLRIFSIEEQLQLKEAATHLNQYTYLKKRHLLVDLRRQQFTLRDSYCPMIQRHVGDQYTPAATTFFDADIVVLPLGIKSDNQLSKKVFNEDRLPIPSDFNEKELGLISDNLWKRQMDSEKCFDFRNADHLFNAFDLYEDLEDSGMKAGAESTLPFFIDTLKYYTKQAGLSEMHKEILKMKVDKKKNADIAFYINKKYEKTYNANYISTIFRQKILKQIAEIATLHNEVMENIFFPENFKVCKDCGRTLLMNSTNFIRKAKSGDGFSSRCKDCDRIQRNRRANKQ